MKDCRGTDLKVGDTIGYVSPYYHDMEIGKVSQLNKTGVTVLTGKLAGSLVNPSKCVRNSRQIIKVEDIS